MSARLIARLYRWWNKGNRKSSSRHVASLDLESLERRWVPSSSPMAPSPPISDQVFLATIYQGDLGRPLNNIGLSYWGNLLNQGVSRVQVVDGILNSGEYRNREITTDYQTLLGRNPDPSGLQYFSQALQQGATPQDVKAKIIASDEYFADNGGNSFGFLNALYGEELGRTVDSGGLNFWTPLTGSADGRTEVAHGVETSPEATYRDVTAIYVDALGRAPDLGGLGYWASQLRQDVSETSVIAGVFGSDEFFNRMLAFTAPIGSTDPNAAAQAFIAHGVLFPSIAHAVPAVPPTPPQSSGGGVPSDDNSGGDVLGNNSDNSNAFVNNTPVDTSSSSTTYVDTSTTTVTASDTSLSSTDSTDWSDTTDNSFGCSCD